MSNTLSYNIFQQGFLRSTVLEHQTKSNSSGVPVYSLLQPASVKQLTPHIRNSLASSKFYGNNLSVRKPKLSTGTRLLVKVTPQAVLSMDTASKLVGKFNLDGNIELQVTVSAPATGSVTQVNIQVTYGSDSLLLHWGGIADRKEKWVLPSHRPEGTKNYKNRALRTPFVKSGSNSCLKIEIDDPTLQAIEFLIVDESKNKWFKNNGENFHVKLPAKEKSAPNVSVHEHLKSAPNVSVPEDLVQIQAYLRWERKGKKMYTPQQEKEEYEAARSEILKEIARGTSVEDLRAKLTKKNDVDKIGEPSPGETKDKITDELVQIQAYIRWEKAGKPNYSPEQQLREFDEARKELQDELEKGVSLDEIRKKITKGEIKTKVAKQLQHKRYFSIEKIQRKKRDLKQLINKYAAKLMVEKSPDEPVTLKTLELYARAKEERDGPILSKRIYKLADMEFLVLVSKLAGKTKVHLATDFNGPITLHWALSKKAGEWSEPPLDALPPGSVSLNGAAETQFVNNSSADHPYQVQTFELEIEGESFVGMPFVLLSDGKWIKNKGSDFYVEFEQRPKQVSKDAGDGKGTAKPLLDKIAKMESEAEKSFMHRFNIAADLIEQAKDAGELGLAGILVWMRFMATRQLVWNRNYNVKPREISRAQDRLTDLLQNIYASQPQYRELLRMIMSTVGRGGEGDVGQRIRDEILVIQRKNDCKGGMMEEWHQKLHNNTSPDDVVICQALIDYIRSDFDTSVYWKTLNENGITKQRLLSYDRAIHSEPNFGRDQKDSLLRDLGNYMRTLKAVHSGADLESAISNCMGYRSEGQGFMVGVHVNPVSGLPTGFPELLQFVLEHVEDKDVEALLEGLLEARQELRPLLFNRNDRLKDLLFLDIALDSTVRTAIERGYEGLNNAAPEKIMYFINMVLENLALSSDDNEDLVYCLEGWNHAISLLQSKSNKWALYTKSVLDRTRLALASKAEWYQQVLQPSAEYLGSLLRVDQQAVNIFTEEIIRAGSAASLSSLLNRLDPVLRKTANLGSWQVISPVEAVGYVAVVDELLSVQNKSYDRPTILVARKVNGEEEIPDGTVAVLTSDMPDVLSHVSVRARNGKVCFATCFDRNILANLQASEGKLLSLKPTSADIIYSELKGGDLAGSGSVTLKADGPAPSVTLVKKHFGGRYAISSEEFTSDVVGAKSRNIAYLKGKVPSWIGVPTSVALPFGTFENVLSDNLNQGVAKKLHSLKEKLGGGEFNILKEIRETVLHLAAPPRLVQELKTEMQSSGMPWPGDEGEQRWKQAWMAIKKVWASKWNERAYFSTRKLKIDHDNLCMAVLVQEVINADYAFVIHTTNPSSGDSSEIYTEVVKGLGETLVGAYPGRALSFICKKKDLSTPQVLGYPSKPIGLFIRRSIIFRSDSNGEDLEGYAGAGLYDSVPMDEEEKVVLDYSSDPLINDSNFQKSILSSIARAGMVIEELYGLPQDIEGVIRDGNVYVVQTRPQM
ncbi:alpha-glucan water dikinase chloroplastic [Tripterygium wilfordii]|uniref:Alpha-glucan water dikinase chloroplastic n=1 Tax=Tripterygium wilfordii TaxID=458696 RepID=A0A7J7D403_TRIWF|nr:alpha-glucan water dikinase, chloroplastic-like isoform X2 [Tripterygium wilfordii]KAF5741084.1 alpha-glucan water dikinase chloroplastic [Tripterygium wilfordii]